MTLNMTAETAALLLRMLYEAGYINTKTNVDAKRLAIHLFDTKDGGDLHKENFYKKYNKPTNAAFSNIRGLIDKLEKAYDKLQVED